VEAVIFAGIQATGKSTFYQQHFFKTHMRIRKDFNLPAKDEYDAFVRALVERSG
jgi:hypothetical protein